MIIFSLFWGQIDKKETKVQFLAINYDLHAEIGLQIKVFRIFKPINSGDSKFYNCKTQSVVMIKDYEW